MCPRTTLLIAGLSSLLIAGCGASNHAAALPPATHTTAVVTSDGETCTVTRSSGVTCWGTLTSGYGTRPEFGTNRIVSSPTPVTGLTGVVQMATDANRACAVTRTGDVACWGDRDAAERQRSYDVSNRPFPMPTLHGIAAVSMSQPDFDGTDSGGSPAHTCALATAGGVWCWGGNGFGQLGDGTRSDAQQPVAVHGLEDAAQLATANGSTCVVDRNGGVDCWGDPVAGFDDGGRTTSASTVPKPVPGISGARTVAIGAFATCVVATSGTLSCRVADADAPGLEPVSGITDAVDVGIGSDHACVLRRSGAVDCWGDGSVGQLGHGRLAQSDTPVPVTGLTDATAISVADDDTCALRQAGTVACWGRDASHEIDHVEINGASRRWLLQHPVSSVGGSVQPFTPPTGTQPTS